MSGVKNDTKVLDLDGRVSNETRDRQREVAAFRVTEDEIIMAPVFPLFQKSLE